MHFELLYIYLINNYIWQLEEKNKEFLKWNIRGRR
jgi:hypothetical protein